MTYLLIWYFLECAQLHSSLDKHEWFIFKSEFDFQAGGVDDGEHGDEDGVADSKHNQCSHDADSSGDDKDK